LERKNISNKIHREKETQIIYSCAFVLSLSALEIIKYKEEKTAELLPDSYIV
jgi:hypothetical protein